MGIEDFVRAIALDKYREIAQPVIQELTQQDPANYGDLSNLWEEIKYQIQCGADGDDWHLYVDVVRVNAERVVDTLSKTEQRVLWFWSNGYLEWNEEQSDVVPFSTDDVADKLVSVVLSIAGEEPLEDDLDDDIGDENEEL